MEYPFKGEKIENLTDIINDEKNNNIVFLLPQKNSNYDLQTNILHITKLLFSFLHSTIKIAGKKKINIIFLYKNQDCAVSAFYDSLNALLNSIRLEHPNLKIKTIKQKGNYSLSRERIESEFNSFSYPEVMFNGSDRFVKLLKKLNYTKDFTNHNMPIKQNGVYIIAGGLGKIGTSLTEYLIKNFNSQVIIISRSHSSISENEKLGKFAANIILLQADISSEKETERIIERISTDFGEINGVFNCCGVISDSLFKNKSINEFTSTINPKILGSINLDNATKDSNLDLFVSFSSVSSLGNIGQTDYSLANEFLNSFADYRMEQVGKGNRSGRTISICWPLWESGSMTVNSAQLKIMERVGGFVPMPTTKGLLALEDIFNLNTNSPYLFYGRPSKMIQSIEKNFIKA
ncbi:SDR family NAD(P)-dependent oxidoreductase [Bacillus subtilis]|uniref:SDR family NAD(P)-dependent oxidoreductase n=1 Tax=Bacillus subtilis TaxID=1423 RepID=UPI0027E10D5E|nr:SDR family NAD(P)-dependent oxidoreductase [Bacillus subtilis]